MGGRMARWRKRSKQLPYAGLGTYYTLQHNVNRTPPVTDLNFECGGLAARIILRLCSHSFSRGLDLTGETETKCDDERYPMRLPRLRSRRNLPCPNLNCEWGGVASERSHQSRSNVRSQAGSSRTTRGRVEGCIDREWDEPELANVQHPCQFGGRKVVLIGWISLRWDGFAFQTVDLCFKYSSLAGFKFQRILFTPQVQILVLRRVNARRQGTRSQTYFAVLMFDGRIRVIRRHDEIQVVVKNKILNKGWVGVPVAVTRTLEFLYKLQLVGMFSVAACIFVIEVAMAKISWCYNFKQYRSNGL
ncbi:hypothetical protein BD779DRAFT_1466615 [Infundibulicybe gibba]|nr:hypothetical protein BD779DRAFT_1466615 [Infundibulicybe gibba]